MRWDELAHRAVSRRTKQHATRLCGLNPCTSVAYHSAVARSYPYCRLRRLVDCPARAKRSSASRSRSATNILDHLEAPQLFFVHISSHTRLIKTSPRRIDEARDTSCVTALPKTIHVIARLSFP